MTAADSPLLALQLRVYYKIELIIGAVDLGCLLSMGAWFAVSVRRSVRQQRKW